MWCTTSPTYIKVGSTSFTKKDSLDFLFRILYLSFLSGSIPSVGRREKASSGSPGKSIWNNIYPLFCCLMFFPPLFYIWKLSCSSPRSSHLFCYKPSFQPAYWRRGEKVTPPYQNGKNTLPYARMRQRMFSIKCIEFDNHPLKITWNHPENHLMMTSNVDDHLTNISQLARLI